MPLRVWAPRAAAVDLVLPRSDAPQPMRRAEGGWWEAEAELAAATDYAFSLDGGEPLPDPRSRWQPEGVHGPSRILDTAAFRWTDAGWRPPPLREAVIYELHPGTFTAEGTLPAAIERLGELVALGVTHVELMPVAEFGGDRGWGYDGVDLFAVHHAYGGPAGLAAFVDAAHARGLAVLLDVVYNHLGPDGNYLARFGPYFTDRYRTPWGEAIDFDGEGSGEVRRFVIDSALAWLRDYHLDGLRLDAVHAIFDASPMHLLEELAAAVDDLERETGRPRLVIAESDLNEPRLVRPRDRGGYGLDATWADDLHHALHAALTSERSGYYADFGSLATLARALSGGYVFTGQHSTFRGRPHGRSPSGVPGERFVVALQNHDQVGNRARGERIGHLVSPGRARIGAALLLLAPYTPLLFMGEEWAASTPFLYFTGHESATLGRAVTEGRRREFAAFGWDPQQVPDPQDPATFAASKLRWEERGEPEHAATLDWYRALIALRRATPELHDGRRDLTEVTHDEDAGWLTLRRGPIAVAVNLGADPVTLPLGGELLLRYPASVVVAEGEVTLPPDGVVVMRASALRPASPPPSAPRAPTA
jgi:maltooligosyltrehalose trehalohydrolase